MMSAWRDLLNEPSRRILPYLGGRSVYGYGQRWSLQGGSPPDIGWYVFDIQGRRATLLGRDEADIAYQGKRSLRGYVAGDRIVPVTARGSVNPHEFFGQTHRLYLLPDEVVDFSKVRAVDQGDGKLVFMEEEFPDGPELAVSSSLERREPIDAVGVTPALELTYRFLLHRIEIAEARRRELEAQRQEEERKAQLEQQRKELYSQLQEPQARRALADSDFDSAARYALQFGSAEFISSARVREGEAKITYRLRGRVLKCIVDMQTLRIIDAGICLFDGFERGDTWLTLESLPSAVEEAIDRGVIHTTLR